MSTAYGVKIPFTDGNAGMAAIIPKSSISGFDFKDLATICGKNITSYAMPIFLRFKSKLSTTATFKFKKVKLKREGFDIKKINEPLYVILPGQSEYIPLTTEIYDNIQNQKYKF